MFTKSKIFLYLLISFIVGVWFSDLIFLDNYSQNILIGSSLLLIIIFFLFVKEKAIRVVIFCLLVLNLGIIYSSYYKEKITPQKLPYNQELNIRGLVAGEPDIREKQTKYTIKVESVNLLTGQLVNSGEKQINRLTNQQINQLTNLLINQKILLSTSRYPEFKYSDVLEFSGKLTKPEKFDQFDYGKYLSRYQIFALIKSTDVKCIKSDQGSKFYSSLLKIKNKFKESLRSSLSEPESSLAEGIVLGSKGEFSKDLKEKMSQTGTTHIVVVSGQNMEIVSRVFVGVTSSWPRYFSFWFGIISLIIYTLLTGSSASVVRAAILASLFLIARLVGRKKQVLNPLIFVGFIMIVINPMILRYDLGFQLSFMAMLGLIFISPFFDQWFKKLPKFIRESLSATLGAQIATMPIILYNFGNFSVLAPITNVLILTIIPTIMGLSFIIGLSGLLWLPLGKLMAIISWPILKYVILVIELFARIPNIQQKLSFSTLAVVIYYLIITILIYILRERIMNSKESN